MIFGQLSVLPCSPAELAVSVPFYLSYGMALPWQFIHFSFPLAELSAFGGSPPDLALDRCITFLADKDQQSLHRQGQAWLPGAGSASIW